MRWMGDIESVWGGIYILYYIGMCVCVYNKAKMCDGGWGWGGVEMKLKEFYATVEL